MSSSEFPRWLWCLGLVLCAACARGPGAEHDPRPTRLVPSEGVNTAPVPVVIEGENFLALTTQQLGGEAPLEVDSGFQARLGDTPLEDVVLEADGRLRAVVPRGLANGRHALTLVSPLGRSVVLPDAYFSTDRTFSRLEARAVLVQGEVVVGQEARLILDVDNLGQTPALGVAPQLDVSGSGRVTVVLAPTPVDVRPGQRVSLSWLVRADAPGEVSLVARVRGRDAVLERPVEDGAEPVLLQVRRPATLEGVASLSAERRSLGQEVEVGLEVHNPGETVARAVTPVAQVAGGVSLLAAPAPVDIPGGERRAFTWRYRADAAGPVRFTLSASGKEALGGEPVRVGPVAAPLLTVQRPTALQATLEAPAHASVGQAVAVSLTVTNTGEATARPVTPELVLPAALEVLAAPVPAESLEGGLSHTFTWSVRATSAGAVKLEGRAAGTDANSGALVSAPAVQRLLTVQMAAQLSGEVSVAPAQTQVSVGQRLEVRLRVRNEGGAPVRDLVASEPVVSGGGGVALRESPLPAALLAGGAEHLFVWTYEATAVGEVRWRVDASGTDANNGAPVRLPGVSTEVVTVRRPAALVGTLAGPVQLAIGQVITRSLEVTNTGTTTARAVRVSVQSVSGGERVRLISEPSPAVVDLAGGATQTFSWRVEGVSEGTLTATVSASGTDALDGRPVSTGTFSTVLEVKRAARTLEAEHVFNDRRYVVTNGGCVRATTLEPRPPGDFPGDWAPCTPALEAWTSHAPGDEAGPRLAALAGQLYLARNTSGGPQLYACTPELGGDRLDCDPEDWSLVAANTREDLDGQLTQFDNPHHTALVLLVATANHLYVGFNPAEEGGVLLRSEGVGPATVADFLYVSAGDSAAPVPVFRLAD